MVVALVTSGAASGAGALVGEAAAVGVGEGVTLAGGGTFLSATGATVSTVVGGATTAAVSTLAAQAAIATLNNPNDPGAALKALGSSQNVKALVSALLTGGVLAGLELTPTGQATAQGGAQTFTTQLGQNLQAGVAKAVINTAVYGGSLESSLKAGLSAA